MNGKSMDRASDRATGALTVGLAVSAATLLVLAGFAFWPRYLSRFAAADVHTHAHAGLGLAWLLVLMAQPLLIRARRYAAHRSVGRCACVLGAAFVAVSFLAAHRSVARMGAELFAREGYFVYMPLVLTALFAAALVLGLVWRSVPAVHGRFMACTALAAADPLLARILGFYFPPLPAEFLYQIPALAVSVVVLVLLLRSLPAATPGRAAFRAFAVGTVSALLLFFATPHSAGWFVFASWFRALPLS